MEGHIIENYAPKIGIRSQNVIRKGEEFLRLADVRLGSSSLSALNLSGSSKAVMCLELAATACGQTVDRAVAAKAVGMQKKLYMNALRAMECLLDLQASVTIQDLVVQYGCTEAKALALQILKRYQDEHGDSESVEYSRTLFNSAALYTACRKMKNKVNKTKLVDTAGVKRNTFDRLVAQMDRHADLIIGEKEKKQTSKRTKSFLEDLDWMTDMKDADAKKAKAAADAKQTSEEENYEDWKQRILTNAYTSLGKQYVGASTH